VPDTSCRDWPNGCIIADVLFVASHFDFLVASNEVDLAAAALDLLDFLRRNHTMGAAPQDVLRRCLVLVDLAEV
jgi:hypothetical protein